MLFSTDRERAGCTAQPPEDCPARAAEPIALRDKNAVYFEECPNDSGVVFNSTAVMAGKGHYQCILDC